MLRCATRNSVRVAGTDRLEVVQLPATRVYFPWRGASLVPPRFLEMIQIKTGDDLSYMAGAQLRLWHYHPSHDQLFLRIRLNDTYGTLHMRTMIFEACGRTENE
jgi:hypothetical protein